MVYVRYPTYLKYTNSMPMSGDGQSLLYVRLKVSYRLLVCLCLLYLRQGGQFAINAHLNTHTLVTKLFNTCNDAQVLLQNQIHETSRSEETCLQYKIYQIKYIIIELQYPA